MMYNTVGAQQPQLIDMKNSLVRMRNMSGGSTGSMESDLSRSWGSSSSSIDSNQWKQQLVAGMNLSQSRSLSESSEGNSGQQSKQILNPGRYKTEMCRPFTETGHCKYGEKCQFAHGSNEMRGLPRHPKYKTELCRTFHTSSYCPYGTRCHFIHSENESKLVEIAHMKQQHAAQQAAKEMVQMQAQHQLLEAQLSAMFKANALPMLPVSSAPVIYTPQLPNPLTNMFGLGSTVNTPPESPVGSIHDEVFLQNSPVPTFQHQIDFLQQTLLTQSEDLGFDVARIMSGLCLDNPNAPELSPSSTPDSLASSVDRGSRLPVFSKLASQ